MTVSELINTIATSLSFLTLVVVFFTLLEMRAQRFKQYKPIIIFEQAEYTLSTKNYNALELTYQSGSTKITSYDAMQLQFKNIGEYPARDVVILADKRNIQNIKKRFSDVDFSFLQEYFPGFYSISDSPNSRHMFNAQLDLLIPYLPGELKKTETYTLSAIYSIMFEKILISKDYKNEAEKLNIDIDLKFSDICGKRYSEKLSVYLDITCISVNNDGEGQVDFSLTMMKREKSKKHLEKLTPF